MWEARCAGKGKQRCVKEMWERGSWGSLYLSLRTVGKAWSCGEKASVTTKPTQGHSLR